MNFYILLYSFSIIVSLFGGFTVYKIYKNIFGMFFLLFTIFISLWFIEYFLFFSGINKENILLYISRSGFSMGVLATYSLLFGIYFYNQGKGKIKKLYKILISIFYIIIPSIYIFTDLIIKGIIFSEKDSTFREVEGSLYFINYILQLLFLLSFLYYYFKNGKKLNYIKKIRLKYIAISAFILIFILLFLQLLLPTFGIWILEKEIIIFFALFVVSVVYIVKRYFFYNIGYGIGKIIVGFISISLSILILNTIRFVYSQLNSGFLSYWGLERGYNVFDIIICIFTSYVLYNTISSLLLGNIYKNELKNNLNEIEQNISHITNLKNLNSYLKKEIQKIFKTNFCEIINFKYSSKKLEIQKYFENEPPENIFINDIVFIEEKKHKFDKNLILEEIPKNSFIVFPIFDKDKNNIGIFVLGTKSFGDFYNLEEINTLKNLVFFLEYHLKYISTYEQINDLSLNLDKKVDEKTIEFNNLINKQKEFISVISHEIRSPISSAIFQADSIIDDIESGKYDEKNIKQELELLNSLLIKTGDLSSKLFSVQYYDTHSINLYKEKIDIKNLLETELEIQSNMNEKIKFINKISKKMGFIEIDKIQFQQVIGNILTNAIKFVNIGKGIILFEAFIKDSFLYVNIEDNGKGFDGIKISELFDKYSIGSGNSVGLGMGLYLCKQIVDMHNGEITASISEKLGGAKFSIKIPIN